AFVTQTTLSIDDTAEIVALLKERFPNINGPHKEDICYATTNRQLAVTKVAPVVDALIVVGAPNSSNSQRLREVAEREGCKIAILAQRASDLDWSRFEGIKSLGITAGASAPEVIVEEIMGAFAERLELHVETVSAAEENEFFPQPARNRKGEVYSELADRPAAIINFLEGVWPRRPNAAHCAGVGEALAKMHLAGRDFPMFRKNPLSVGGWRPLFDLAAPRADSVAPGLQDF